jgi:hypothetical protein
MNESNEDSRFRDLGAKGLSGKGNRPLPDSPQAATVTPPAPSGQQQVIISGNNNSGVVAGRDIHGSFAPNNLSRPVPAAPEAAPRIQILFLGANPQDATRLQLDHEIRGIDQALRQGEFRQQFDLQQHWAVRVSDLQTCLLRHRPQIIHFSGHGSSTNAIFLEDAQGTSQRVEGPALARLFAVFKKDLRCVVLNACYSEQQAEAITEHIDCVIGMSRAIGDQAAISFAAAFYQALAFGSDVQTAFELGCVQIDLERLSEEGTPRLLARRRSPAEIVFA